MSVRTTDRIIGDLVKVTALKNSPEMVVKAYNNETKIVNTVWFLSNNSFQEGFFPASALDRVEEKANPKTVKSKKGRKPALKS